MLLVLSCFTVLLISTSAQLSSLEIARPRIPFSLVDSTSSNASNEIAPRIPFSLANSTSSDAPAEIAVPRIPFSLVDSTSFNASNEIAPRIPFSLPNSTSSDAQAEIAVPRIPFSLVDSTSSNPSKEIAAPRIPFSLINSTSSNASVEIAAPRIPFSLINSTSSNPSKEIAAPRIPFSLGNSTSPNSSVQIAGRLNPSNSFLTTVDYDVSTCSCGGTDNLRFNGIWMSWDNQRGSRPDNAVYSGDDSSGSGYLYVMRVQLNVGLVVGKYAPKVKSVWIPYGGLEYGGYTNFEVLRHSNYIWEGNTNNQNLWIPGGKSSISGNTIYICSVFYVINPSAVYQIAYNIPGKYEDGKCWISYAGYEYSFDKAGSGPSQFKILKRAN